MAKGINWFSLGKIPGIAVDIFHRATFEWNIILTLKQCAIRPEKIKDCQEVQQGSFYFAGKVPSLPSL